MATTIPPPSLTGLWVDNPKRRQQILDDNRKLQLEDYRTINPERGPVRGYGGSS